MSANEISTPTRFRWTAAGLCLTTMGTLVLEILDTRLLSVLTWYHLSFLAVSLAMLGMAAGAVFVFLAGDRFNPEHAPRLLPRYCTWLAWSIPVSHLLNLSIPIPLLREFSVMEVAVIGVAVGILAIPFIASGVVVTLALTRTSGQIGKLYAADLFGAAVGCLVVIGLLNWSNITSVAFAAGAMAAAAAWCFERAAGVARMRWGRVVLTVGFLGAAVANAMTPDGLRIIYPKNRALWLPADAFDVSAWNTHSHVTIQRPQEEPAFFWGPGEGAEQFRATTAWIAIDGEAGTPITKWDGDPRSLEWAQFDVTSLPYHLRRGEAAVIGAGGGRDLLSALWGGSRVTGIEVNAILVDALRHRYREFAHLGDRSDVTLVHDEARAFLSRRPGQYDVVQMSLIDTWAATGAGAFSLSENGLYTREAWRVFLDALTPSGVFSVSRWFARGAGSETNRVLALGVAALFDSGVGHPADHLIMLSRGRVATLVLSRQRFSEADEAKVRELASRFGFSILAAPWQKPNDARLERIVSANTLADLSQATRHTLFDFSPPTDERPFFFSMLKPRAFLEVDEVPRGGIMWGNLRATSTLLILLLTAGVFVGLILLWPLGAAGRPDLPKGTARWALAYFAAIGCGFMLVQIPFLQRFSVFLGHPTYALAIVLFTMILAAGIGSAWSDRIAVGSRAFWWLPVAIAVTIGLEALLLQAAITPAVRYGLPVRSAVVVAFVAPISVLLGCCFPLGMRLVSRTSPLTMAWMWGVNGACGVMASIGAVGVSMWIGTQVNLLAAGSLYLLLLIPMRQLVTSMARTIPAAAAASPVRGT